MSRVSDILSKPTMLNSQHWFCSCGASTIFCLLMRYFSCTIDWNCKQWMHLVPMILNIPLMSSSRQNRNDCVIPFGCQAGKRIGVSNFSGVLFSSTPFMLQGLLEKAWKACSWTWTWSKSQISWFRPRLMSCPKPHSKAITIISHLKLQCSKFQRSKCKFIQIFILWLEVANYQILIQNNITNILKSSNLGFKTNISTKIFLFKQLQTWTIINHK